MRAACRSMQQSSMQLCVVAWGWSGSCVQKHGTCVVGESNPAHLSSTPRLENPTPKIVFGESKVTEVNLPLILKKNSRSAPGFLHAPSHLCQF